MRSSVGRQLAPFLTRPRLDISAVALTAVISGFAEAGTLLLIVRAALSLTGEPAGSLDVPGLSVELSTGTTIAVAAALGIVTVLAHLAIAALNARISSDVLSRSQHAAIEGFTDASWECQSKQREGTLQHTVSTLSLLCADLARTISAVLAAFVSLFAFLAVALLVDPISTIVVVIFGLIIFALLRPISSLTKRRSRRFVHSNNILAEDVNQLSSMAMELRAFGVAGEAARRIHTRIQTNSHELRGARFAARFGSTLYRDLAVLLLVGAVALIYATEVDAIVGISTVVVLIIRALSSAQTVQSGLQSISEKGPNLDVLEDRLSELRRRGASFGTECPTELGRIEFRSVSYAYNDNDEHALKEVSLSIEPGEVLGIVGPSGGGKSTFVQLLLRLRTPTSGTITVGGLEYQEIEPDTWSHLVSFVPQEPKLIEGTIADNIVFLRDGFDSQAVVDAATAAHVSAEVEHMPAGFATILGPRGAGLSGGQKQRVAIARSLIGKPQLLVLDEPTSALDVNAEQRLKETIATLKGDTTMVIVAHRLTTLEVCDRILVLENGRVSSLAPPHELRAQDGFFRLADSLSDTVQTETNRWF